MTLSADPTLARQFLVEVFPYDEDAASTDALYLASRDVLFYASDPDAPSPEYDGRLLSSFALKRSMARDSIFGGASLPSYGAIRVVRDTVFIEEMEPAWRRYGWDGRRIRILMGLVGAAYADHELLLDGVVAGTPDFGLTEVSIPIADLQERLSQDVETATYAGTGGFAGGADLKGKVVPFAVGAFRGFEPVPVDPPNLWWDVSPTTGLIAPLYDVTDGAAILTPSASNPPPAGSYYLDAAAGRVRTGSQPVYRLRVSGRSAFHGGATTAADITEGLLLDRLGFAEGELNAPSFAATNTANSAAVGKAVSEATTGQALIDELIDSVGGYYTGNRYGKVTLGIMTPPTATSPTDPQVKLLLDDTDLAKGRFRLSPADKPPYRVEIGCQPNLTQLTTDQVAAGATDADRSFALSDYRVEFHERPATKAKHLLSKPLRRNTRLDDPAAGLAEATRLVGLISVYRETATADVQTPPLLLELGDEVWVQSDIYAVDAAFRVVGDDQNAQEPRVTLALWR